MKAGAVTQSHVSPKCPQGGCNCPQFQTLLLSLLGMGAQQAPGCRIHPGVCRANGEGTSFQCGRSLCPEVHGKVYQPVWARKCTGQRRLVEASGRATFTRASATPQAMTLLWSSSGFQHSSACTLDQLPPAQCPQKSPILLLRCPLGSRVPAPR